jgi:hypothetical protein
MTRIVVVLTVLKFHISNDGSAAMEEMVLAISIIQRRTPAVSSAPPRILAGPFVLRADVVLQPGYTTDYEIVLRNISLDCGCKAQVRVIFARRSSG